MFVKIKEYVRKVFAFIDRPIPFIIFCGLCFWRLSVLDLPGFDKGVITGWIAAHIFFKFVYEPQQMKKNNKG